MIVAVTGHPLLGPLKKLKLKNIDWVIVGGESGHRARPMDPAWVTDIRDQCAKAGNALRQAVINTSLGAFCFPPGRCPTRCDHDSQCTLPPGHGDRHETDHGCICYDPTKDAK